MKRPASPVIVLLIFAILFFSCLHTATDEKPQKPATLQKHHPTMRVLDRFLYTAFNEKVILRGINKMIIWTDRDGIPAFSEIARTGANCVRIVWLTEGAAGELDTAIANCIAEKMIPMIELHDATGAWDKLPECAAYWSSPEIAGVIRKHEEYLLVNIANEVGDASIQKRQFIDDYTKAVLRMREAGIRTPIIIDSSDWGKDIDMLQACGFPLIEADPIHNLVFSVHMWWPSMWGYDERKVQEEIKETVDMHLPLIVGEFGNMWEETDGGQIPFRLIISECEKNEIGWLAWSWGPGNKPQRWLDMTKSGHFSSLSGWGLEVAVTHRYGIKNTSKKPASLGGTVLPGPVPDPAAWRANMESWLAGKIE